MTTIENFSALDSPLLDVSLLDAVLLDAVLLDAVLLELSLLLQALANNEIAAMKTVSRTPNRFREL